jgi:threonine dehydratase
MPYKSTRHSRALADALQAYEATPVSTVCPYDPLGSTEPRPEGTIAAVTGRREPEASLRRICRQCYTDWMAVDHATAHHMVKRLYEQLTGECVPAAAVRAAMHRDYLLDSIWEKVETEASARDRDAVWVIS